MYIYIYIYVYSTSESLTKMPWWRTNRLNTTRTYTYNIIDCVTIVYKLIWYYGIAYYIIMGPLRKYEFRQIGGKGAPWHFWGDKSRLTGVPKRSLCQKSITFAVTPLVLTAFVPFRGQFVDWPNVNRAWPPSRSKARDQSGRTMKNIDKYVRKTKEEINNKNT